MSIFDIRAPPKARGAQLLAAAGRCACDLTSLAEGRSSGFSNRHCCTRSQISAGQSCGVSGVGSLPLELGVMPVTICRFSNPCCHWHVAKDSQDGLVSDTSLGKPSYPWVKALTSHKTIPKL
jgi:hypothetical protein